MSSFPSISILYLSTPFYHPKSLLSFFSTKNLPSSTNVQLCESARSFTSKRFDSYFQTQKLAYFTETTLLYSLDKEQASPFQSILFRFDLVFSTRSSFISNATSPNTPRLTVSFKCLDADVIRIKSLRLRKTALSQEIKSFRYDI